LRLPVFDDFEIGLLEVRNGRAALIRNDDIDPNEIDSRAELRQLTLVRRILLRGRGRLATIAAWLRGLGILAAILLCRGDGVLRFRGTDLAGWRGRLRVSARHECCRREDTSANDGSMKAVHVLILDETGLPEGGRRKFWQTDPSRAVFNRC
jgi:hypothetical protein